MRYFILSVIMMFAVTAFAASGAGVLETGPKREVLQGWKSEPSTAAVATLTGAGVFKNISSSTSYRGLRVWCTDANLNYIPCKYQYNGTGSFLPIPSGERIFLYDGTVTYIRFGNINSATTTLSSEKF